MPTTLVKTKKKCCKSGPRCKKCPAVYKQLAGPHRMMIGLANDMIGYIIPKRQWDAKPPYAYKRKAAQYGEINSLGPETAR